MYVAPEVFPKKVVADPLDPENTTRIIVTPYDGFAADDWSLGVLLYCIETGKPPFAMAKMKDEHYSKFLVLRESAGKTTVDALEALYQKPLSMDPVMRFFINALLVPHPPHRLALAGTKRM